MSAAKSLYIKNKKGNLSATFTDTVNANLQGTQGPAVVGDNNAVSVTNNTTDAGAIAGSIDLANKLGTRAFDFADNTQSSALDAISTNNRRAFDFAELAGREAIGAAKSATDNALNLVFKASQSDTRALTDKAVTLGKWAVAAFAMINLAKVLK